MRGLGVLKATIVTLCESDHVKTADGSIAVVPAWRWALE